MKINELEYSIGNKKIGTDTIIINMGSALDCSSLKRGLCQYAEACYAMKAERQYPPVKPFRDRQEHYWLNNTAEQIATDINEALNKHKKIKWIRFNESGDFHSGECLQKLIQVSNLVDIRIYTYTARRDLITNETHKTLPANLAINTSNFERKGLNAFGQYEDTRAQCRMDCSVCNICKTTKDILINVPVH